jgi:hypothetical protein
MGRRSDNSNLLSFVASSPQLFDAVPKAENKTKYLETHCLLPHPLSKESYAPVVVPARPASRSREGVDDARKYWQRNFQSETLRQQKMEAAAEKLKNPPPRASPIVNAGIRTVGGAVPWTSDYVLYQQKNSISSNNMLGQIMKAPGQPGGHQQESASKAAKLGEQQANTYISRMENVQRTKEVHKRCYPQTSQRPF